MVAYFRQRIADISGRLGLIVRLVAAGGLMLVAGLVLGQRPTESVPSEYAPIQDIENQLDYFTTQIKKDLEDPADYSEDRHGRVEKNASTLAVLALVLANHDEDSPSKPGAAEMLKAAQLLAENAGKHEPATRLFESFQQARSAKSEDSVSWEPVADLSVLMKQIPIVNNSLRRGVSGRRFKKSLNRTAGLSATLAALAQASAIDSQYCSDEEEEGLWYSICSEMRDSAASVNAAVRNKDQAGAKAALARLVTSCDKCHDQFRAE